jgi:hypothetical protein
MEWRFWPEQKMIQNKREGDRKGYAIVDCETEDDANHFELPIRLQSAGLEPRHARLRVQSKHA